MQGLSVLNYSEQSFVAFSHQCEKIKLKEIDDAFAPIDDLDAFAEDVLDGAVKNEGQTNVHLHFFQNSVSCKKEETNFVKQWNTSEKSFRSKIFELDTSLRVTNIQNINCIIRDICNDLSKRFKIPMTCNMYVSPHEHINCLGKHADIQETFIFQVMGHKLWTIYQNDDDEDIRLDHSSVARDNIKEKSRSVRLDQREILYTPSNLVHKVECDKEISSIHLNFALNLRNKSEPCHHFFHLIQEEMKKHMDFNRPLDSETLGPLLKDFQSVTSSFNLNKIIYDYERKQFLESIRLLKEGRKY